MSTRCAKVREDGGYEKGDWKTSRIVGGVGEEGGH